MTRCCYIVLKEAEFAKPLVQVYTILSPSDLSQQVVHTSSMLSLQLLTEKASSKKHYSFAFLDLPQRAKHAPTIAIRSAELQRRTAGQELLSALGQSLLY